MRQKIRFEKNVKDGILTVLESSEVDPGVVMPLHEEEYDLEAMTAASKQGCEAFSELLRRRSFFPTAMVCGKLFEGTAEFFQSGDMEKVTIEYDDVEALPEAEDFQLEEDVEIDKILEEDGTSDEDELKEIDDKNDTPVFKPEDNSEHEN